MREGHGTPGDHDAREPDPGADFGQKQVAGQLEQQVADEEQGRAQPERGFADAEVAHHLQLGVADVLPVDIGNQVHDAEHGHQVADDLADNGRSPRVFVYLRRSCRLSIHKAPGRAVKSATKARMNAVEVTMPN